MSVKGGTSLKYVTDELEKQPELKPQCNYTVFSCNFTSQFINAIIMTIKETHGVNLYVSFLTASAGRLTLPLDYLEKGAMPSFLC